MLNMCVTEEVTLQTELKLPEQLLMTLSTLKQHRTTQYSTLKPQKILLHFYYFGITPNTTCSEA